MRLGQQNSFERPLPLAQLTLFLSMDTVTKVSSRHTNYYEHLSHLEALSSSYVSEPRVKDFYHLTNEEIKKIFIDRGEEFL